MRAAGLLSRARWWLLSGLVLAAFVVLVAPTVSSGYSDSKTTKPLDNTHTVRESGTDSVAMLCFNGCNNPSDYIPLKMNIAYFSHSRYPIPTLAQNTSLKRSIGIGRDDRGYPTINRDNQWVLQVCQKNLNCGDDADNAGNHFDGKNRNDFSFTRGSTDLRHYAGGELDGPQTWAWIKRHPQANHTPEITSNKYGANDTGKKAVDVAWRIEGRCSYPGTNPHDCNRNSWTRYYLTEHQPFTGRPRIEPHHSETDRLQVIWDNPVRYETNNEGLILTNNRGEITARALDVNEAHNTCYYSGGCDPTLGHGPHTNNISWVYRIQTFAEHRLYKAPNDNTRECDGTPFYPNVLDQKTKEASKKWGCWLNHSIWGNSAFDYINTDTQTLADSITLPDEYKQERQIFIRIGYQHYSFGERQWVYSPPTQHVTTAPMYRTETETNRIRVYTPLQYSGNKTSTQYRLATTTPEGNQNSEWTQWITACTTGPGDQINWIGGSNFPDNKAKEQLTITATQPHPTRNCGENTAHPLQTNTHYIIQTRHRDDSSYPTYQAKYGSNTVREVRYYTTTTPIHYTYTPPPTTTPPTTQPPATTPTTQPTPITTPTTQPPPSGGGGIAPQPPANNPPPPANTNTDNTGGGDITINITNNIFIFVDATNSVHQQNIIQLAEMGITQGCNPQDGNTKFCPDRPVTRAEMATFLTRTFNLPPTTNNPFTDTQGNIHQNNINRVAAAGITSGCNPPQNTRYCPNRPVTRAEMATFIVRTLNLETTSNTNFDDTTGNIHQNNINTFAAAGITQGCNPPQNTRYCPNRPVTRGEMATFLIRSNNQNQQQ